MRLRGGVVVLVAALGLVPSALAATPVLTGRAHDGLGNLLEGVQVLVLPDRIGAPPVGEARTAYNGRFSIRDLEPGVYRVAAIKKGYLTYLGRVDTLVRPSLDIVLRPMPSSDDLGQPLPADAGWTLRLPERSVLRSTGRGSLLEANNGGSGPDASRLPSPADDIVGGKVVQQFALAGGDGGAATEGLGLRGSETDLGLAAVVAERGRIDLRGHRERLRTAEPPGLSSLRESAAADLHLTYDLGLDDRVEFGASYERAALNIGEAHAAASLGSLGRSARRSWACQGSWSAHMAPWASLQVDVGYRQSALDLPPAALEASDIAAEFSNRTFAAATSFESSLGEGHQLRLAARTRNLELPLETVRTRLDGSFDGAPAGPGWNLVLDAEDAWSIGGRLTLVYGLAYQAAPTAPLAQLVPRAGAVWSADDYTLRAVVAYFSPSRDAASPPAGAAQIETGRPLGYDLSLEAPVAFGFRVKGARRSQPVAYGFGVEAGGWLDTPARPIYVTDGAAAIRQDSLQVERGFGTTGRAYVRLSRGRAAGTLGVGVPAIDLPYQVLAARSLRYADGQVGISLGATGTEVLAEYRRVESSPVELDPLPLSTQDYVEVRVAQDLPWLNTRGMCWKVLLGARKSSGTAAGESGDSSGSQVLAKLGRQMSAGVSVAF